MIDWNRDGKVDAIDYAITSDMMDDNRPVAADAAVRLWQCF